MAFKKLDYNTYDIKYNPIMRENLKKFNDELIKEIKKHMDNKIFIEFAKIRDVKNPLRANDNDAGIDFFVPNDFLETKLNFGEDILIPSGIRVILPKNTCMIAHNKSGVATKLGLICGADLIDEGYRGEVHFHLIKATKVPEEVIIKPGMKIIQFVITMPLYYYTKEIEFVSTDTKRGEGGFGSTGIN